MPALRRFAVARFAPAVVVPLALIAPLFTALPLGAQEPAVRAALTAFDDSLATADAAALAAFEAAPANRPAGRDALGQVRLGLILLRRGALEPGREPLDAAIRAFDEATVHAREWPWPFLGLARARRLLGERGEVVKPSRHQPAGMHYDDAIARDLARALEIDPAFAPAAHFMADLLAASPGDYPEGLHTAIRAAAAVPANGAGMQLMLGRLARHLREDRVALAAFRTYEVLGGDPGVAALETARTRIQMSDTDAAADAERLYLAGFARSGATGRAAYRSDLAHVATVAELESHDALSDGEQSRDDWVRRFWGSRDAAALRRPGERLSEHLRRWTYAVREFRAPSRHWGREGAVALAKRADAEAMAEPSEVVPNELLLASALRIETGTAARAERVVTDLGFMYIRHGEPVARVQCEGGTVDEPPTVSWVYPAPEGTMLVHFASGRVTPFPSLVRVALGKASPVPCLDRLAAYNPTFGTIAMRIAGADARRATYAMLARGRTGEGSLAPHEFIDRSYGAVFRAALRDRDRTQRLLHTDSYFQRFERDLAPVIQLYAVGTPASGRTGVLAVFAVRADRLTSEPGPEGRTLYPVRLRLAAVDSVGGTLRTIDTLRTFVVRSALPKGAWLSGTLELPLAPGTYDVRLLVTQPGDERGGAGGRLGVQIPGTAAELTISDIVSGEEGRGLAWHGAGAPFPLNPLGVFRRDATVELLYELGGLRTGAEYRTTLEISKGEGSDDRVSLRFTEAADGAVARVRRSIGLAGLRGGRYVLRLEVEEVGTGRRAVRERWLDVE